MQQLLQRASEMRCPHAQNKADRVHKVAFAGAIGAYHSRESFERPNLLFSVIAFEVLTLQADNPALLPGLVVPSHLDHFKTRCSYSRAEG